MKRAVILICLVFAFKAPGQTSVPAQYANKYAGQLIAAYGYVYRIVGPDRSGTAYVLFGSKIIQKGIPLKISSPLKLGPNLTVSDLKGRFITVTGKVVREKSLLIIDGDDPSTRISVMPNPMAFN